jgi:hypothetical protein
MDPQTEDFRAVECIVTFANTQDAIEGEKKLLAGGICPGVMPLPDQLGAGCGICLRVGAAELKKARAALGNNFQGIYAARAAPSGKKVFTPWNV